MSMTPTPRKWVERALGFRCHWIAVTLLAGRPDLGRALVAYEESLGRPKKGDPYKSFPIPQPQEDYEPPSGDGPTKCKIVGRAPAADGSIRILWQKDDSLTPGDDVEQAIRAGSTEVIIEVTKWGKASRNR